MDKPLDDMRAERDSALRIAREAVGLLRLTQERCGCEGGDRACSCDEEMAFLARDDVKALGD